MGFGAGNAAFMQSPSLNGLSRVASRYEALLCDAWGVIHDGVSLFAGAADALLRFRAECGPVVIITNAPRPATLIPAQLDRLGLPRAAYDAVVTSGDATRAQILARAGEEAFRIGPEKDDALFADLDIRFSSLDDADYIVCTGLRDEIHEGPEDYRRELSRAAARNIPMICANPDVVVRWGGRLIYCAGALAELYASLGGVVHFSGKPHAPIYKLARAAAEAAAGRKIAAEKFLAIGDGVQTDIAGARVNGMDAIYIAGAGGVHQEGSTPAAALERAGLTAVGVMETLVW